MLICKSHRFVFIRNPKTASRSLTEIFENNFDVIENSTYHSWYVPEEYSDYFVFMFVRNPYSRTVSAWQHVCRDTKKVGGKHIPTFAEFVDFKGMNLKLEKEPAEHHVKKRRRNFFFQAWMMDWVLNETKVNRLNIFKYENLEEDFHRLPFIKKRYDIPRVGVMVDDWMQFYTSQKIKKMVYDNLKIDFERFGYYQGSLVKLC